MSASLLEVVAAVPEQRDGRSRACDRSQVAVRVVGDGDNEPFAVGEGDEPAVRIVRECPNVVVGIDQLRAVAPGVVFSTLGGALPDRSSE